MFVDWVKCFATLKLSTAMVVVLFWGSSSFAQGQVCDSIYLTPTDLASYKTGVQDLSTYYLTELVPLIEEKYLPNGSPSLQLTIVLTINLDGNVEGVDFPNTNLTHTVLEDLMKKLLEMKGWKVAKHNGIPVCSEFRWVFSCLILG
jgi:hypothetical protein